MSLQYWVSSIGGTYHRYSELCPAYLHLAPDCWIFPPQKSEKACVYHCCLFSKHGTNSIQLILLKKYNLLFITRC